MAKECGRHKASNIKVFGFVSLCRCFLTSIFHFYAKIYVRCEIFIIVDFVAFSLANISTISCRFSVPIHVLKPNSSVTHFVCFNKIGNRCIFKTFPSGDSSPMLKSCPNKYYFIDGTSIIVV